MPHRRHLHEAIREAADPLSLMDRIVAQALDLVPAADGASFEVPRDADTLEYVCAAGTLASHVGLRLPLRGSLSGAAAVSGEITRTDDAPHDPRVDREAVLRTGVVSMLCVPVDAGRGGVSVLKVSSQRAAAFTDADVASLKLLADFMGSTVTAASDLAGVTADLLGRMEDPTASPDEAQAGDVAQFVANVLRPGMVESVETVQDIADLVAARSIRMEAQPIVELATGRIVAWEALARFPGEPPRSPDQWFDDARRAGRIVDLELVAVAAALELQRCLPAPAHLAVNVGPETVVSEQFAELLAEAPCELLTIELTEHERFTDYRALKESTDEVRRRGALLSIDDTGAGYSSLTHILQLRPDVIKLDRDLTFGVEEDLVRQSLATALVAFAAGIGASVVAEGIETAAAQDRLLALGVKYGQGFHLGRPAPVPLAVA